MNEDRTTTIEALLARADWARGLARRLVRDEGLADDVVQSAYLAALENPPEQAAGRDAWLRRVIRNVALATRRGDTRREKREIERPTPEHLESTGADHVARMEMHRELSDAILRLDERYRTVVIERYYEGRSSASIAAAAGIPSATVRNQLKRALDRLRADLDGKFGSRAAWMPSIAAIAQLDAVSAATPVSTGGPVSGSRADASAPGSFAMSTGVRLVATIALVALTALVASRLDGPSPSMSDTDIRENEVAATASPESESPRTSALAPATRSAALPTLANDESNPDAASVPPAMQASRPPSLVVHARLADGTPAPGCRIRIDQVTTSSLEAWRVLRRQRALSIVADEAGIAIVDRMEEGRWIATTLDRERRDVALGGDATYSAIEDVPFSIDDREVTSDVTLIVGQGKTIRGRVVDPGGEPLEGCSVSVRWGGRDPRVDGEFRSANGGFRTDANGRFECFEGPIRDEPYALVVRHRNSDDTIRLSLAVESEGVLDLGTLVFASVERGTVHGRLEPRNVNRVELQVFRANDTGDKPVAYWRAWPEDDDALPFQIHGLAPGDYELRVDGRPDHEPIAFTIAASGDRHDLGTIRLQPMDGPHRIFGTVVDIEGNPIAEAKVTAGRATAVTTADGTFENGASDPGPFRVVIDNGDRILPLWRTFDDVLFDGAAHVFELRPKGLRFDFVDAETGDPAYWNRVGIHAFKLEQRGQAYCQRSLGPADDMPRVSTLRERNLDMNGDMGRIGLMIYVDGYEAAEVTWSVPEDINEREYRLEVPLVRL